MTGQNPESKRPTYKEFLQKLSDAGLTQENLSRSLQSEPKCQLALFTGYYKETNPPSVSDSQTRLF